MKARSHGAPDLAPWRALDFAMLEQNASNIALVREDGTIVWVNRAWRSFGAGNGAELEAIGPGASYFAAVSGDLREWFVVRARECVASGAPFEASYECSSPSAVRTFRMRLLPVAGAGFLAEHSLCVEIERTAGDHAEHEAHYRREDGKIVMCSNCRRTRTAAGDQWDFVAAWVSELPRAVSHGICAVCAALLY